MHMKFCILKQMIDHQMPPKHGFLKNAVLLRFKIASIWASDGAEVFGCKTCHKHALKRKMKKKSWCIHFLNTLRTTVIISMRNSCKLLQLLLAPSQRVTMCFHGNPVAKGDPWASASYLHFEMLLAWAVGLAEILRFNLGPFPFYPHNEFSRNY